jgi:hypothetical protein
LSSGSWSRFFAVPPFHRRLISHKLFGRGEGGVVQHHDDFLLIRPITTIADDKRRGHPELFLKA